MYFQPGSGSGGTDFAVDGICGKFYNVEQNFAEVIPLYQIIDAHCHIYPDAIARKAAASTGNFYDGLPATCDGTLGTLLQEGRQAGIDHFVVQSVATKPEQVHSINEFIAKEVAAFPQKLTGLGTLHPDSKDMAGDIAHALELGLKGIKLHPDIQHFPLDDPRCMIIYESCQGKIPILLHTGDKRFDFSNPNRLLPVLRDFPGLTVIGAHFGGYSIWQEAAAQLHGIPNFYVDCSSTMFALPDAEVVELIRLYGADRVMFGTDYPMWSPVVELAHFQRLPLTQEERALILHKNAEAIFGIA